MIAFATQAVRDRPGPHFDQVASALSLRERGLFGVVQVCADWGGVADVARELLEELDAVHAERLGLEKCFTRANLRYQAHLASYPMDWGGGASLIAATVNATGRAMVAHVGEMAAFRVHDDGVERVAIPHLPKVVFRSLG